MTWLRLLTCRRQGEDLCGLSSTGTVVVVGVPGAPLLPVAIEATADNLRYPRQPGSSMLSDFGCHYESKGLASEVCQRLSGAVRIRVRLFGAAVAGCRSQPGARDVDGLAAESQQDVLNGCSRAQHPEHPEGPGG